MRIKANNIYRGILLLTTFMLSGFLYSNLSAAMRIACSDKSFNTDTIGTPNEIDFNDMTQLRVLDIGNSYTMNSTSYLRELTEDLELDTSGVCLYRTIFSGGSFKNWHDVYNDTDTSTYYVQKVFGGLSCDWSGDNLTCHGSSALRTLLNDNVWDIIIIHQASRYAAYYGTWLKDSESGYLEQLLGIIRQSQPQAAIGTHLIHSYSKKSPQNKENFSTQKRWRLIASSIHRMAQEHGISLVIPYGTVIERLRATPLNNKSDLLADGTHLSEGLACYAATCCYYESVFAPYFKKSMVGNSLRPMGEPSVNDESAAAVWDIISKVCADPYQIVDELPLPSGIKSRISISDDIVTVMNVTADEEIYLYSLEGQLIRNIKMSSSSTPPDTSIVESDETAEDGSRTFILNIRLPRGVSILKIDGDAITIFVP